MTDFFEKLIAEQLVIGAITDEQGDTLRSVFDALSPQQLEQLQEVLVKEPRFVSLLIDNIAQKLKAVSSDDLGQWKAVVADETKKLDALL